MERQNRNSPKNLRAWLDYVMGLFMVFAGIFVFGSKQIIGEDYFANSSIVQGFMKWFIGIMFIIYGLFRIYRGYILNKRSKL